MSDEIKNYIPVDKYYVYLLMDPRTDLPFYVGKGIGNRVKHHYRDSCVVDNPHKTHKIKRLKALGYQPKWTIIFETQSEQEALEEETRNIIKWGRKGIDKGGLLTNIMLFGGEENLLCGPNAKKVDQYDLLGNYIQTFDSCQTAARACGKVSGSPISVCCSKNNSKRKSAHGFYWSYNGTSLELEWCLGRKYFVYQWDLQGNFIATHSSLTNACINTNTNVANIQSAIKLKTSANKFQWTKEYKSPGKYVPTPRRQIKLEQIYQWDFNGALVRTHNSVYHAIKHLGIRGGASNIRRSINTKRSSYDFQWTRSNKSPGIYKKLNYIQSIE